MNKAEKMLIAEKFEAVILALPSDVGSNDHPKVVLVNAVEAFRKILKAL